MLISQATHRCKICNAYWRLNELTAVKPYGSWSLVSKTCGKCCDNCTMGEQIELLNKKCVCGAEKCRTIHSDWCPKYRR